MVVYDSDIQSMVWEHLYIHYVSLAHFHGIYKDKTIFITLQSHDLPFLFSLSHEYIKYKKFISPVSLCTLQLIFKKITHVEF